MMKRRSHQLNLVVTREIINTYCCYTFFFVIRILQGKRSITRVDCILLPWFGSAAEAGEFTAAVSSSLGCDVSSAKERRIQ